MKIQYRHQAYEVDPCALILRGDSFYAKITLAARIEMTVYVKVDPRLTGMDYCYPQPAPQPLIVVLTPEMAANVNASALVQIVVRKPVAVSLYALGMRAA